MSALHREFPDATPEEIETKAKAALLRAPARDGIDYETRQCRDCDRPFLANPAIPATRKWGALCSHCLSYEL